ncbi:MAG: ABC transporter substrate-binding protein [Acidimicrobiales bacterium]
MKRLIVLFALLALLAVACGDDGDSQAVSTGDPDPTPTAEPDAEPEPEPEPEPAPEPEPEPQPEPEPESEPEGTFPVTVAHGTGEITFEQAPQRIVSLSPTATEMLFAIGAGDQVIAVDDQSNYPPEAPMTDLSGFTPNVEAIIGFEPDLVVSSGLPEDIEAGLAAAQIPSMSLFFAASLDDTYSQIEVLGVATGRVAEAAELVATMMTDIEAIVADAPTFEVAPTYYHELDSTYFSATSSTFIGQIYGLIGLENIADEADEEGFGFPQLSAEYILEKNPDLIYLADTKCCGESVETVAARPGWDQLTAVQMGQVVELDDDIASRWGPRVVEFLEVVADATFALEVSASG